MQGHSVSYSVGCTCRGRQRTVSKPLNLYLARNGFVYSQMTILFRAKYKSPRLGTVLESESACRTSPPKKNIAVPFPFGNHTATPYFLTKSINKTGLSAHGTWPACHSPCPCPESARTRTAHNVWWLGCLP